MQFYRFLSITTERLVAHPNERPSEPMVLKRIDDNNQLIEQNGNGLMVSLLPNYTPFCPHLWLLLNPSLKKMAPKVRNRLNLSITVSSFRSV